MHLITFSHLKISEDFFLLCNGRLRCHNLCIACGGGGGMIYFTDKESCKRNKIRTDNMWYVKRVFFCSHTEYIKLEGKSKSIAHTQVDFKVLVMEYNEQFMYKLYCCSLSTY